MRRTKGFTLIEILVAVGIIALLVAMLVYGTSHLSSSARGGNTRAAFESAKLMLAEYEQQIGGRLGEQVGKTGGSKLHYWLWTERAGVYGAPTESGYNQSSTMDPNNPQWPLTPSTGTSNPAMALNFWTSPYRFDTANPIGTINRLDPPEGVYSPGLIDRHSDTAVAHVNRNRSVAMLNTHLAMIALQSLPANRRIIENLPSTELASLEYEQEVLYLPGMVIKVVDPNTSAVYYLRCTTPYVSSGSAPMVNPGSPPTVASANWAFGSNAPFLLDGWGNPICFVPGGGMQVGELYDNGKTYNAGDRAYVVSGTSRNYFVCVATTSGNTPPNTSFWSPAIPVRSPDGRPFFASAGPDGNFDTDADNLYSFKD